MAVHLEHHIDAIAGRSSDFAHNASFGFGQGVYERAFSNIASPHDSDLHHGWLNFRRDGIQLRDPLANQIEQFVFIAILLHADSDQPTSTKPMKFVRVRVQRGAIRFVGDQQDWLVDLAQTLGHFLIQRQHARTAVDNEQQNVGIFNCGLDLRLNLVG